MIEPRNNDEWQQAVNAAAAALSMDFCRQYGLIECDLPINVDRCEQLLKQGKCMGIVPRRQEVDRVASEISRMHRWGKKWRHHHAACQEKTTVGT